MTVTTPLGTPLPERNYLRMGIVGLIAVALLALLAYIVFSQMTVILLKAAELSLAAYGGYWFDRWLFPYSRPHELTADTTPNIWSEYDRTGYVYAASMLRRAIIVGSAMLAMALAL